MLRGVELDNGQAWPVVASSTLETLGGDFGVEVSHQFAIRATALTVCLLAGHPAFAGGAIAGHGRAEQTASGQPASWQTSTWGNAPSNVKGVRSEMA